VKTPSPWNLYDHWQDHVDDEGRRLAHVLEAHRVHTVVDAAAGGGRLASALAERGFHVVACEPDEALFRQALEHLAGAPVSVALYRVGLPGLAHVLEGPFDAAFALHDALARHSPAEQGRSLEAMARILAPKGLALIGLRDWEGLLRERTFFVPRRVARMNGSRLLMFDVRLFRAQHVIWTTFYLLEQEGKWRVHTSATTYYPITPARLEEAAAAAGLTVAERADYPHETWWVLRRKRLIR